MVCLRNICINTLHKGDGNFTYNNNNNNNNNILYEYPSGRSNQFVQIQDLPYRCQALARPSARPATVQPTGRQFRTDPLIASLLPPTFQQIWPQGLDRIHDALVQLRVIPFAHMHVAGCNRQSTAAVTLCLAFWFIPAARESRHGDLPLPQTVCTRVSSSNTNQPRPIALKYRVRTKLH
jgi:hypothetical protein